jgi:hypothetical protein
VLLGGPVVALGLAGALAARLVRGRLGDPAIRPVVPPEAPGPLFEPPLGRLPGRARLRLRSMRLPEQYRSILQPSLLVRAAAGPPWFWVAITAVLAFLVTR